MILYGVRSPGPGSDIAGDVVEWFETRAEAEQFIAEVAGRALVLKASNKT
jgi:hypothetical protein